MRGVGLACHPEPVPLPTVKALRIHCDVDRQGADDDSFSQASFRVSEFAELSDGRDVALVTDRGWSGSSPRPSLSMEEIERNVYNVLLPDWADVHHPLPPDLEEVEDTGGAQDWVLLSDRLSRYGVTVTADMLAATPRRLVLGELLRARLDIPSG
jgi:hypothetical protein